MFSSLNDLNGLVVNLCCGPRKGMYGGGDDVRGGMGDVGRGEEDTDSSENK